MKIAAIDVGSNSIHMIIVEVRPDGSYEVVDREKEMVGLGRDSLQTSRIEKDAMERGLAALRKYSKLARRHRADKVLAVATSAVRESLNGGDFIELIRRETGIRVRVITGTEEARLIGLAAVEGIETARGRALVVDIGGGSVELGLVDRGEWISGQSLKLGVIRLAERFLGPGGRLSRQGARRLRNHVRSSVSEFLEFAGLRGIDQVVGTSGTILALGALASGVRGDASDPAMLNGRHVPLPRLRELAETLPALSERERSRLPGVGERRSDTILTGAVLLATILEDAGADEIVLCDRALREGIVADYLRRHRSRIRRMEAVPSVRMRSVLELAERCGYNDAHASQVRRLAAHLFDATRPLHRLPAEERSYLEYGAILHDIGTHIAFQRHHRHGYYLVKNGGLRGFRPEEVELIAGLVLYHRKRLPEPDDPCVRALPKGRRRVLEVLAGILRLCDGLDRTSHQVVGGIRARTSPDTLHVFVDPVDDAELEIWAANRKARLLERALERNIRVALRGRSSLAARESGQGYLETHEVRTRRGRSPS